MRVCVYVCLCVFVRRLCMCVRVQGLKETILSAWTPQHMSEFGIFLEDDIEVNTSALCVIEWKECECVSSFAAVCMAGVPLLLRVRAVVCGSVRGLTSTGHARHPTCFGLFTVPPRKPSLPPCE